MCPITRVLVAATISGMLVADLTGNQALGWMVAVGVGALFHLAQSRVPWLGGGSCVLPPAPPTDTEAAVDGSDRGYTEPVR